MFLKSSSNKILGTTLFFVCLINPAVAHNVKTDGDVGATFHLEPNHNPRAGEPARTWFALTRAGGKLIPLEQCDCKLAVYSQTTPERNSPLLEPSLQAISAEQYEDIPGADITFPEAGAYELELSGKPKSGNDFKPFKLTYTVNVIAGGGNPASNSPSPNQIASASEAVPGNSALPSWLIPGVVVAVILSIGSLWWLRNNSD